MPISIPGNTVPVGRVYQYDGANKTMKPVSDWIKIAEVTTMTAEALLSVNNIEVVYNKTVQVLRGLSLKVDKGAVVALLGSNGAGKSTTLKAVSNLLELEDGKVTTGEILFKGDAISRFAPHQLVRSGLFHVMEGRRIFEDLTVEENLTAATYAMTGRQAARRRSISSTLTSRACSSGARDVPDICQEASSKCWQSARADRAARTDAAG